MWYATTLSQYTRLQPPIHEIYGENSLRHLRRNYKEPFSNLFSEQAKEMAPPLQYG